MREAPNRITGVHAPENNGTAAATCVEHRHSRPHPRWSAKNVFRPCFAGPDGRRGCGARGQRALRPAEQGGIIINFAARRTPEKAFRGRCQRAAAIRPISHAVFTQETASLMRGGHRARQNLPPGLGRRLRLPARLLGRGPVQGVQLYGNYAYMDARIREAGLNKGL